MATLICFAAILFLSLHQSSTASRIDFHASSSSLYPVVTKVLTLRCAVQQDPGTEVSNLTTKNDREVQSAISESLKTIIQKRTHLFGTEQTTPHLPVGLLAAITTTHPSTIHPGTTHPSTNHAGTTATGHPGTSATGHSGTGSTARPNTNFTIHSNTASTGHPHTTVGHHDTTHGNVSHIVSIIIAKQNKTTGHLEPVASVSPYDPPTASVAQENIKVNGTVANPNATQQGYLEVSWAYPTEAQSGDYTCDVYALDSTLHPVALASSVRVRESAITVSQLAEFVAENDKQITKLQQSLSDATNQISILKQENQKQFEDIKNTTDNLLNQTTSIKAQNIQTGTFTCSLSTSSVTFPIPYREPPTVFFSVYDLRNTYNNGQFTFTVSIQNVTSTGFTTVCSHSTYITSSIHWIAVDN
jgi:hypothetical protein